MEQVTVSMMFVTFNRVNQVKECVKHNLRNSGAPFDQLVWVDNGSKDGCQDLPKYFHADCTVLNSFNQGVSVGYNQALAMCRSDWIVIVGDRNVLPTGWLKKFKDIAASGLVDSVCMYEVPPMAIPERWITSDYPPTTIAGCRLIPAIQNGSMIFRRSLLGTVGYWREDFGMYGWNDIEWARRMRHRNIRGYAMVDEISAHSSDDGTPIEVNGMPYRQWVNGERDHPSKAEKLKWCEENGYPYFSPFQG